MTTVSMDLMYQVLIQLQEGQTSIRNEMREGLAKLGNQINSLEGGMGLVLHYAGDRAQIDAAVNQRFDAMQQKIHQLEDMINEMRQAQ